MSMVECSEFSESSVSEYSVYIVSVPPRVQSYSHILRNPDIKKLHQTISHFYFFRNKNGN